MVLSDVILLPLVIVLPFIGSLFILSVKNDDFLPKNTFNVSVLTVVINIAVILEIFKKVHTSTNALSTFVLEIIPLSGIEISLCADSLSLILMFGTQIAILLGILGAKKEIFHKKNILFYALIEMSFLNGYFLARDIFSFYIFFAAMLWPLYMMIGLSISQNQQNMLERLMMHYLLSTILFLASLVLIWSLNDKNILISDLSNLNFSYKKSIAVWGGLFVALILRMPIWPFHHAIISLSNTLKDPLVFIVLHMLPLSGIYAFMRFWPLDIPIEIEILSPVFQYLCVLTMIFASFGGYAHTNAGYKLYHYIFVYDLLYLLGVFLPTDKIVTNIAYSMYAFMIISSGLVVLQAHMSRQAAMHNINIKGMLCMMPRTALSYALFVFAGVGLPISALFWNNFIIASTIFNFSLYIGTLVVIALTIAAVSMIENLYTMRNKNCSTDALLKIKDIDRLTFIVLILMMIVLFLSFLKPLWFVF